MASGKTYWGLIIARVTGLPFTDLDTEIEEMATKSVHAIFADHGEEFFREAERDALHALETAPPGIVATGGGTPCFFDNMDWMNAHGRTIYLETPADVLLARQRLDNQQRLASSGQKADRSQGRSPPWRDRSLGGACPGPLSSSRTARWCGRIEIPAPCW